MLSDSPIDASGSQISPGLAQRSHGSSGSVAVELDGMTVRIADIDGRGAAPAPNGRSEVEGPSRPGSGGCVYVIGSRAGDCFAFGDRRTQAVRFCGVLATGV